MEKRTPCCSPGWPRRRLTNEALRAAHYEYERTPHFTACLNKLRRRVHGIGPGEALPSLDLDIPVPCPDLILWLNCWGCHIPEHTPENYETAAKGFADWWGVFHGRLPSGGVRLTSEGGLTAWGERLELELNMEREKTMAVAFDRLRDTLVKDNAAAQRRFGKVATSKILYVLRPHAYLAWDNPIMRALGFRDDGASYLRYVQQACSDLVQGVRNSTGDDPSLEELEDETGCTALELINKYYWVYTRKP